MESKLENIIKNLKENRYDKEANAIEGKTIKDSWMAASGFVIRFTDSSKIVFGAPSGNLSVDFTK